jgi:hypothetical protein
MRYVNVYVAAESDVASIGSFVTGTNMSLGLTTELDNNKWYLVINNPQDYENTNNRFYRFFVLAGATRLEVALFILNVDDEFPYYSLPDSTPCAINVSNAVSKQYSLHIITD